MTSFIGNILREFSKYFFHENFLNPLALSRIFTRDRLLNFPTVLTFL